jgi:hypothetical protein
LGYENHCYYRILALGLAAPKLAVPAPLARPLIVARDDEKDKEKDKEKKEEPAERSPFRSIDDKRRPDPRDPRDPRSSR